MRVKLWLVMGYSSDCGDVEIAASAAFDAETAIERAAEMRRDGFKCVRIEEQARDAGLGGLHLHLLNKDGSEP